LSDVLSDGFELAKFVFELNRGFVAEGGMEPASIVDVFEEGANVLAGFWPKRECAPAPSRSNRTGLSRRRRIGRAGSLSTGLQGTTLAQRVLALGEAGA
jgi:hypothetical protein